MSKSWSIMDVAFIWKKDKVKSFTVSEITTNETGTYLSEIDTESEIKTTYPEKNCYKTKKEVLESP